MIVKVGESEIRMNLSGLESRGGAGTGLQATLFFFGVPQSSFDCVKPTHDVVGTHTCFSHRVPRLNVHRTGRGLSDGALTNESVVLNNVIMSFLKPHTHLYICIVILG